MAEIEALLGHLDFKNPHSFEVSDLTKLIKKVGGYFVECHVIVAVLFLRLLVTLIHDVFITVIFIVRVS